MIQQGKDAIQNPIGAPSLGGAISALIVWLLQDVGNIDVTPEAAVALAVVVTYITQRIIRHTGPQQ